MTITNIKQQFITLFTPPFTRRKILYLCLAAAIILFIIIIIVLSRQSIAKNTPTEQTIGAVPKQVPNSFPNGGRYQMPTYSIAYPQGSQNSQYTFEGGTTLIIQPPDSSGYPNQPLLDVEAYNSKQNLEEKQMWYLAAGATKSTLVINNMQLPELKNTYKMRTINSKPIHTPTQIRLAYLVKPNGLYVFRMYYSSSVSVPADEDLFAKFIQSFRQN